MTCRYRTTDTSVIIGKGAAGKTVVIDIWDDTSLVVDGAACTEYVSGIYKYEFAPGVAGEYYWEMNGPAFVAVDGHIVFGGYVDNITNLDATVSSRATPADIQDVTIAKVSTGVRNLELITKSVSRYYTGQTATLVAMTTYAGIPATVDLFTSIYDPSDIVVASGYMDALGSTGVYTYDYPIPASGTLGVYKARYTATKTIPASGIVDTFTTNASGWTDEAGTWIVASGFYNQTGTSNSYTRYNDALARDWVNYTVEGDVRLNHASALGGIGLHYKNTSQQYNFIISIGFQKALLRRGTTSLKTYDIEVLQDTWYTLKVEVENNVFSCYMDDDLLFEVYDETYDEGTPALYAFYPTSHDNVTITVPEASYQEFSVSDFQVENEIAAEIWSYER